jgi:hypothetical protein
MFCLLLPIYQYLPPSLRSIIKFAIVAVDRTISAVRAVYGDTSVISRSRFGPCRTGLANGLLVPIPDYHLIRAPDVMEWSNQDMNKPGERKDQQNGKCADDVCFDN